ncbi:response regulator receiver domain-containing protein [Mycobacterium sp. BK558]|uniref:Putative transcriptional regulator n=1 Tax=Mycolicibacterium chubuense TaxID=1800 RepID=A0A0J6WEK6_MYCCU|nr:response regulator transcription factor [Mycolicibacterium chubuense]KMO80949.1 putative transcriptional regulator [Mycolicibacterium chubuense]ORA47302.1 response regulator [Mycolicibacterium chubuense]RZT19367.1 response regulator receiver domain-containing protein [Mycobacterium sp. BK558]SPY00850.1 response regulator receiver protein [Mycolicibacterium chubuense]
MTGVRCLIVDDSPGFRDAARDMLERADFVVVGTAADAEEAEQQARALRPDLALVDVDLGADSGFDVAERLAEVPVILTSTHDEQDFADLIAASPALGFLPKFALSPVAINRLLAGRDVSGPRGT